MALTKRQEKQVERLCAIEEQRRLIYRDLIKMLKKEMPKLRKAKKSRGIL